jgi:CheY-like chemotaxis protein
VNEERKKKDPAKAYEERKKQEAAKEKAQKEAAKEKTEKEEADEEIKEADEKYCPACHEYIKPAITTFGADTFYSCPRCGGSVVDPEYGPERRQADEGKSAKRAMQIITVPRALIGQPDEKFRALLKAGFEENRFASEVSVAVNGEEVISKFAVQQRTGAAADIVVLDLSLPILPGPSAAIAIRAMEESTGSPIRAPIIFTSSVKPPNTIGELLDSCKPSRILQFIQGENQLTLMERMAQIIANLQKEVY